MITLPWVQDEADWVYRTTDVLMTVTKLPDQTIDLLARYRCTVWSEEPDNRGGPLFRVTTETVDLGKQVLELWYTMHTVGHHSI